MKYLALMIMFCLTVQSVFSQDIEETTRKVQVTIMGGGSFPQGDFGSSTSTNAGVAATGYAGSLEVSSRMNPALSWTSTASVVINPLDEDEFNKNASGGSAKVGSYTGLWGLTGIKFNAPVSPSAEFYGQAQGGLLYSSFPDIELTFLGSTVKQTATSKITFGFAVGAGVQMNKLNIGVRYYSGKPEYEQTATFLGNTAKATVSLPMTVLMLMVGITL